MIENELTYLAKYLPENLKESESKKIIDLYIDNGTDHSDLRIRKNGDKHQVTRKRPVTEGDASKQLEETIEISETEFNSLLNSKGRKTTKTRFFYDYNGLVAEFDVFEDNLQGLVLIDFEFETEEEKEKFIKPDFCSSNVTQEDFVAGGLLAGKQYSEIESDLNRLKYNKI